MENIYFETDRCLDKNFRHNLIMSSFVGISVNTRNDLCDNIAKKIMVIIQTNISNAISHSIKIK